jgi:hypothetical protein
MLHYCPTEYYYYPQSIMSRNVHWPRYESSNSTQSGRSDSEHSYETNPTEYSDRRPSLVHSETCHARVESNDRDYFATPQHRDGYETLPPRSSVDTYASTSEEDLADDLDDDMPEYQVPQYPPHPATLLNSSLLASAYR